MHYQKSTVAYRSHAIYHIVTWWHICVPMTWCCHQMETFSALLALWNSPHKGQWRGALMFSLICALLSDWGNNHEAGDLRRHRGHYDVNVMELMVNCSLIPKPVITQLLLTETFGIYFQLYTSGWLLQPPRLVWTKQLYITRKSCRQCHSWDIMADISDITFLRILLVLKMISIMYYHHLLTPNMKL